MKNLVVTLAVSAGLLAGGCSNDENSSVEPKDFINLEVAESYKGTQSPGDVWSWVLDKSQGHMIATWDHGTFDDSDDDISIEGTFETLPSGFMKVTITKAEPVSEEIPTDGTAWFYAMEVPGMAMIIKPEGSIKGDIIAMVPEGECASIPGTYNYVISAPGSGEGYDPITEEAFGYLDVEASGAQFELSGYKWSLDCINGGNCSDTGEINGIPMAACSGNGDVIITDNGNTVASGRFTNAGTMIMDFGYGNGGAFALRTGANATKDALMDNTYFGIAYMPKNENDRTVPVQLSFMDNGLDNMIGTGYPFSDIESGIVDNDEGVVVLVENIVNGRVYGTMNFDNDVDASSMAAALLVKGNDQIMILTSYDEADQNPFILILAKKN